MRGGHPPSFPSRVEDLTPELLTAVLGVARPEVRVEAIAAAEAAYALQGAASTADRVELDLRYAPGADCGLPARMVLKTMLIAPHAPKEMYEIEVRFYRDVRPQLDVETPQVYAAVFDADRGSFGILMEDLRQRGARFPNVLDAVSLDEVRSLLANLARLHARYWGSRELERELAWVGTHVEGKMADFFRSSARHLVAHEVARSPVKQGLVDRLRTTVDDLYERLLVLHRWQATAGPQTLLHGDSHIGNTYLVAGVGGHVDWQLLARGHWSHDVSYLIATSLPTPARRTHERDLVAGYLDSLAAAGAIDPPAGDQAWTALRRSMLWGFFIGWMITPVENYGASIQEENLERLTAAVEDYETLALIDALS